ncbi:MAG: helix-turn-helix domain-containing protein [Clostridia bacterium]|nr:helix-turn-helix domain-containing protein [Clostridia bacterium]
MASRYAQAFAQNLNSLMKENGMTQGDLARAINVPQQTISRYVTCKREVTLEYLCKIADYFGEDIDVLIGRREY